WVASERITRFSKEEKAKFLPLTPDFVLELMSPSDNLAIIQAKMREYQENGVNLGWLINTQLQQVEIYRPGKVTEVVNRPTVLSGEAVLPEFVIELDFIWQ
ncbi:MAG: Uma2 family endonuclease, partial [Cyanobacteria bacterium P01_A01_bin.84]